MAHLNGHLFSHICDENWPDEWIGGVPCIIFRFWDLALVTHSWVGPLCQGSLWWSTSMKHSLSPRVYEGVIQIRRNTSTHWSLYQATNEITCCLYCLNQSLGDKHLLLMHTVHLVWAQVEELGHWWMILMSCVWSVMGTWLVVIVNKYGANECDVWVSVSNSGSEYKLVWV